MGRSSRPERPRTNAAYRPRDVPGTRAAEASAWACATPPTRKNSGITWSSQVTGCSAGTCASTLVTCPCGVSAPISQ